MTVASLYTAIYRDSVYLYAPAMVSEDGRVIRKVFLSVIPSVCVHHSCYCFVFCFVFRLDVLETAMRVNERLSCRVLFFKVRKWEDKENEMR